MSRNFTQTSFFYLLLFSFFFTNLNAEEVNYTFSKENIPSNIEKDSCNLPNFLIDDIKLTDFSDDSFLSYTFLISFREKKSSPKILYVLMTLVNCKNQQQTIKTELTYIEKTNSWTSKQGLMQTKECSWKLSTYRIVALNECGDEYATNDNNVVTLKSTTGGGNLPARDRILARRRRS